MASKVSKKEPLHSEVKILESLDTFLKKRAVFFFGLCIALTSLLCILLFDARMSFAVDDADYILMAHNFVKQGVFPTYHGGLYVIFLSLFMKLFGMNIPLFKALSAVSIVAQIIVIYFAFRGRVPYIVLFVVLLFLSVNPYFLYYGSQTFSEAFTMFVIALFFLFGLAHLDKIEKDPDLRKTWLSWLGFGLGLLLLSLTKNILIVAVLSAIVYFFLYRQWRSAGLTLLVFLIFKIPYELMVRTVFHGQTTSQLEQIMRVDFYNPSKGYEDFPMGYMSRLFENFNRFVSVQMFKIVGIRPEHATVRPDITDVEPSLILSVLFAALFVLAFRVLYKRNRYMMFCLLFSGVVCMASCTVLQTIWSVQPRLILPFVPYFLLPLLAAAWYAVFKSKMAFIPMVYIALMAVLIFIQLPLLFNKIDLNKKGLSHYLKGDISYNIEKVYPFQTHPEFRDFVLICDSIPWKVPKDSLIANGNPGEALVYSGCTNFRRIAPVADKENADSVLMHLRRQKIAYLFADGNSKDVAMATQILIDKYPQKLKLVSSSASSPDRNAYLFKINY